jgi:hypothetical protein
MPTEHQRELARLRKRRQLERRYLEGKKPIQIWVDADVFDAIHEEKGRYGTLVDTVNNVCISLWRQNKPVQP